MTARLCFRVESVSGTSVVFDGGQRVARYRKCEHRGCSEEPAYVVIKTVSCLYPRRRDGVRSRGLHEWLSPRRLCEEHARSYCAKWDIEIPGEHPSARESCDGDCGACCGCDLCLGLEWDENGNPVPAMAPLDADRPAILPDRFDLAAAYFGFAVRAGSAA
jgi:hypothetical protein